MHQNVKAEVQIPNSKAHPAAALNTSGSRIAMQSGSHWMLAELDLTSNEVAIYDWLTGMDLEEYNQLAGVSL